MPEPGGHRAGPHLVDAQDLEGGRRPHHVDDGVVAADLVEVDLVDRAAVEPSLHLGQRREGGQGPPGDPLGQPGLADQADDVGVGPHHHVVLGAHHRPGGGDATPQHRLDLEGPAPEGQPLEQGQHLVEVGAGIEQAAERHVPGDPGEAVEPGHRARPGPPVDAPARRRTSVTTCDAGHGSIRATAQAAPNPLSMPTTVMPAAHEACMASSAVTPSSAAP